MTSSFSWLHHGESFLFRLRNWNLFPKVSPQFRTHMLLHQKPGQIAQWSSSWALELCRKHPQPPNHVVINIQKNINADLLRCVSIYPSIHQSHLPIYQSIHPSTHPIYRSIYRSNRIYRSIYRRIYLSMLLFTYLSIFLLFYLSKFLYVLSYLSDL